MCVEIQSEAFLSIISMLTCLKVFLFTEFDSFLSFTKLFLDPRLEKGLPMTYRTSSDAVNR